jgi:hypothetical protein
VIQEILTSKVTYNMGLQMIDQLVTTQLKEHIAIGHISVESEIVRLFDLLGQVRLVSSTLSTELGACFTARSTAPISHALQTIPRVIIIYFDYIQCYHTTLPLFVSARQTNKPLAAFLTNREEVLGAGLDSFLITAVQRPPRYRLLFQELLKATSPQSEDYAPLKASVARIAEEVGKLDQVIDELQEANALAVLAQRPTDFQIFAPSRKLLFWGKAVKFSRKRTNDRVLILLSDILIVANHGLGNSLRLNKLYKSCEYLVSNVSDCPPFVNAVDIRQKTKSFRVNLTSPAEKQALLEGFEKMKGIQQINRFALEHRGFAPVWIPDDQAPKCMVCNAEFAVILRRHHCRACGNCICKSCFSQKSAIPGLGPDLQRVCPNCFRQFKALEEARESMRRKSRTF